MKVTKTFLPRPTLRGLVLALAALALLATPSQAQTLVLKWRNTTDAVSTSVRDIAYNPATGNLLQPRFGTPPTLKRFQSSDGLSAGADMDVSIVSGGSLSLAGIAVLDDGTIFGCNTVAGAQGTTPLKVYKWEGEGAVPTLVYQSTITFPGTSAARFGTSMDAFVRPGVSTNLLFASTFTTSYALIFDSTGWYLKTLNGVPTQSMTSGGTFLDYNAPGYANKFRFVAKTRQATGIIGNFDPSGTAAVTIGSASMGGAWAFIANGIHSEDYDHVTTLLGSTSSTLQSGALSYTNMLFTTSASLTTPVETSRFVQTATAADAGNVNGTTWGSDHRLYSHVSASGAGLSAFDVTAGWLSGPGNKSATVGDASVTLSTLFAGSGLSYQWSKGGSPLSDGAKYSGVTTASLTINNIVSGDAGEYTVAVNGDASSTASASGILFVGGGGAPADRTWNGGDANDNLWSSADNWGGTALNTAGDKAFFDGTTRLTPVMDGYYSVNGLTFNAGAGAFNISSSSGALALTGGVTNNSTTAAQVLNLPMVLDLAQVFDTASKNIEASGSIAGAGSITKLGAQTLKLSGSSANTFNGLTVGEGNVLLGKTPGANAVAGNISLAAGTSLALEASDQISDASVIDLETGNATLTLPSSVTDTIRGFSVSSGTATAASGNVQLGANAQLTIKPAVGVGYSTVQITAADPTGTKFIVDSAGGELRWTPSSMVNTFEKLVIQNGGRLRCGHGGNAWLPQDTMLGAVPSSFMQDQITINNGQLGLNSLFTVNPPSSANTLIVNGNRGLTISGTATLETIQNVVWPGKITGTGKLIHNGGGELALLGPNDYSGGTDVGTGTITINGATTLGSGPIRWINSFAALAVSTEGLTIANPLDFSLVLNLNFGTPYNATNFTCSGDIDMGNSGNRPQVNVTNAASTITFTGKMFNTLGLVKMGPGKLVLTGANEYGGGSVNGNTSVTNGTLLVNNTSGSGTSAGTVDVWANSTLAGTGSIQGPVSVHPNGTVGGTLTIAGDLTVDGSISPGSSVGTLTTGIEFWNGGGSYVWEMNDALGSAGSSPGWDKVATINGGYLTVNATAGSKFNIKIKSLAGNVPGNAANFNNAVAQTWTILASPGGIYGFDPAAFNIDTSGFSNPLGWSYFTVATSVDGLNLELKLNLRAAPENLAPTVSGGVFTGGTFTGTPNTAYTVRYTDSLNPVNWQVLATVTTSGTGAGSFADPGPLPSQRFYRIFPQ